MVLVHGGLGPKLTWERQRPLAERWDLVVPTRRGFPGGPPADHQDFERDAEDIAALLDGGAHLVGFSYGGLGVSLLAAREPERVRSLTLVEVPLYLAAPADPSVEQLAEAGDAFLSGRASAEQEVEFLANAGIGPDAPEEHRREIELATRAARGGRSPREALPDLDAIARGVPSLVVSGEHHEAIESLCDALGARLGARRAHVPGAGHAVPRAPGFNDVLESFLLSIGR